MRALLFLSLALVQAQYYHQHHTMPRAKFDAQTGAPLNAAARSILQRHAATAPAPGAGAAEATPYVVSVLPDRGVGLGYAPVAVAPENNSLGVATAPDVYVSLAGGFDAQQCRLAGGGFEAQ